MEATIKTLATKDDIAGIRKEMGNLRSEMGAGLSDLRKEIGIDLSNFHKEMGEGNIKLHQQMVENRTDNIKWMFIFWIGQFGVIIAVFLLLLKK